VTDVVVFMDLDDSIFQTRGKCRSPENLVPAALGPDGAPLSFMEPWQHLLLDLLSGGGPGIGTAVIPATARDLRSFGRVLPRFTHGAILDFGGLVLGPSGQVDRDWLGTVSGKASSAKGLLDEALRLALGEIGRRGLDARARIVSDLDLPFYLVAKTRSGDPAGLGPIRAALEERLGGEASVFLNGNNLSLLPAYLDKAPAAEYFLSRYFPDLGPGALVLGLGDGLPDRRLLSLCHYCLIPARSQLGRSLL
jgi:hypothetical protein